MARLSARGGSHILLNIFVTNRDTSMRFGDVVAKSVGFSKVHVIGLKVNRKY